MNDVTTLVRGAPVYIRKLYKKVKERVIRHCVKFSYKVIHLKIMLVYIHDLMESGHFDTPSSLLKPRTCMHY